MIFRIWIFFSFVRCEYDYENNFHSNNSTESNEIIASSDYSDVSNPNCRELCKNGSCIDTDTCLCDEGYLSSHIDKFDCEPICDDTDIEGPGCTNGVCIAPQTCECFNDFVPSEMHPFACISITDDTHEFRDSSSNVFWVLMSAVPMVVTVTIIAFVVWTTYQRKMTYVVDESGNFDNGLGVVLNVSMC